MHNVQVFPLVGLPQFNGWSQVLVDHDQRLMCALAVEGQNAGNIGRDLVIQVQQAQLETPTQFYALLQKLITLTQELEVTFLCAAAFIIEDQATYATFNGAIILKRQNKVGTLLTSGLELKIIQGSVVFDDLLVLSTNAAQAFFGEIQQKATQGYEAEIIMNSLVSAVHDDTASASISLAFLEVVKVEKLQLLKPMTEVQIHSASLTHSLETAEISSKFLPEIKPELISQPDNDPQTADLRTVTQSSMSSLANVAQLKQVVLGFATRLKPLIKSLLILLRSLKANSLHFFQNLKKIPLSKASSEVSISPVTPRRFKRLLILAVAVVAVILIGSLVWQNRRRGQIQAAQLASESLTRDFAAAQTELDQDPVTAREKMQTIISELEALENNFEKQPAGQKLLQTKLAGFKESYQSVSGRAEFSELPVFFDLSSIQSDFIASEVASNGSTGVFIDIDKKEAIILELATKQSKRVFMNSLPSLIDAVLQDTQLLTLGNGIHQFNLTDAEPSMTQVVAAGDSNREAKLLSAFSDYLYVLNPVRRNIYRYLRNGDQVSDPIGWLKPGQSLPYDQLTSIRVDGDVWLGTKTGEILKLSLGESVDFVVTGLAEPFTSSLMVDTQPEWQNIYVLEPAARRVVVLSKTGQFVKEVKSASLASATQLVADEAQGKVLAISGSVVFDVSL